MTIYLLLVPVLVHFSLNGATATWTLPEFWTAFVALLSLFQIAMVAVLGLVLMAITAVIAGRRKN
jgi:hypothetical protein